MDDPCVTVGVEAPDGARLAVRGHGGHVVGWTPAGGRERLWLSPLVRCGPGEFTAALHGYLALGGPEATVRGLGGHRAEDNEDGLTKTVPDGPLLAVGRRDIAVRDVTGPVTLDDLVLGPLTLTADGFADRVMWNPGPDAVLGDVPPGGAVGFVCIESAQLAPVTLAPGETWTGRQTLQSAQRA